MSAPRSALRRLGRWLEALRLVVASALLLLLVGGAVGLAVSAWQARPRVPEGAALVLAPRGVLVEQLSRRPGARLSERLTGVSSGPREVLLRDILDALRLAQDDARILALSLDVDRLRGGMSKLAEVRQALLDFRASGKPVVAYTERCLQGPYYLLASTDELYLHPEGLFVLHGFGGHRPYYKEGLDRFGIDVHVFRVGAYKSAVEPYLRNDMSPEAREADREVLDDLWRTWRRDVGEARGLSPDGIQEWIEGFPAEVQAKGGDVAQAALDAGFVDHLGPRDAVRARLVELVGEDDEGTSFKRVGLSSYLAARAEDRGPTTKGEGVAVVVAAGDMLDGSQPPGRIGGDSTARLIRRAREDEDAKAVVLRVDSGGGSAFASEIIRRECELVREAGKPLVVSMSSVAASAAYAISSPADEIWASPSTITGSIGIFAVFPSFHEALARHLGVHYDGVGTTRWTDPLNPGRPLDPKVAETIQAIVDHGYESFVRHVAEGRGQTWDEVDRIARGRVWSGEDALDMGLVDALGDLEDAIASAAEKAGLEDGHAVFYVGPERTLRERLIESLLGAAERLATGGRETELGSRPPVTRALRSLEDELGRLALWNDPRGLYGHCLCAEEWP